MAFEISGYVVEGMRVGQSNATFTQSPDNLISDQAAFDAAYPDDESAPRADYMIMVTSEGTPHPGLLESAKFGWTKNEIVARFTYDAQGGAFKPLRGSAPVEVGILSDDANVTRLRARPPVQADPVPDAPFRLSVGGTGSGIELQVMVVANDSDFEPPAPPPPAGTVQISKDTGNLNWAAADVATYSGQRVRFQQQQFYELKDSTGKLGFALVAGLDPVLLLNPLPGPNQYPRLRFGYGLYLTTQYLETEAEMLAAPEPSSGTVLWAGDTGRLRFNPVDTTNHAGVPVYYDGVLFETDQGLPGQARGTVNTPDIITNLPELGAALIFSLPGATPYYRFPSVVYLPELDFNSGKKGEVQVDHTSGKFRFSDADKADFGPQNVVVYFGDLPIEHGISVRLLRNPVNLAAALPEQKDVTAIYKVKAATWADPIIQSPQVSLPALPIEDAANPPVVQVLQGQGYYVDDDFPNLNVVPPPTDAGLGYYIDYDAGLLYFAERKVDLLIPIQTITSDVVLPDPLLLPNSISLFRVVGTSETELVIGEDVLVDTTAGVVSLVSTDTLVGEGTASVSGTRLTDPEAHFETDGVEPGNLAVLANEFVYTVAKLSDPDPGPPEVTSETSLELDLAVSPDMPSVTYAIYESHEILADRYFVPAVLLDPSTKVERIRPLGVATNSPRLTVPVAYAESCGFRLGGSQSDAFATVVVIPDDPPVFSDPASLPAGTVEISKETGELNFASADLGTSTYSALEQVPGKDYELQPELGLVHFRDRMLSGEEARITYTVEPPSTLPRTLPGPPITEYATFLIRKEVTQPHPAPTSVLSFNIDGLPVTLNPAPAVFRGGRPQELGVQCVVDPVASQITFLPDNQITDALPHGPTVNPNERVYIDYYVTKAVGGEKTFTVLHPPMLTSVVTINEIDGDGEPNNQFVVHGDHTETFPSGHLMRIENEQVYQIGSSSYDGGNQETTVVLAGNQVFQSPFSDPRIYVSSGPTPIDTAPAVPAYFTLALETFEPIPRGSNTFVLAGDQTLLYRPGAVVLFTDGGLTSAPGTAQEPFTDFLQVTGSAFEDNTGRTVVMLSANTIRQYIVGEQVLLRSVRPVFEPPVKEMQTSRVPKLTEPYVVYRRVTGEPGQVLSSPVDYTISGSGHLVFAEPLAPDEEFGIIYTGLTTVDPGNGDPPVNLKASYTCQIAPSVTNGLLGQILLADYNLSSPDTFYYRVETMTQFRAEFALEIATQASSGSSGPQTSNMSQPKLWEQGRKSLYFDEKHLANQDIIARGTLLFYNDLATLLEAYKTALDGSVVGNNDGSFLFDGTTGHVVPPATLANQIDDAIKVSPAPYEITYDATHTPPFTVTSVGTFRKYYTPGNLSRFYPTQKNFFGVTAIPGTPAAGDEILDTGAENITTVSGLHTRLAWALVTKKAFAGETTLTVDNANGSADHIRPRFIAGMKFRIQKRDGSSVSGGPFTLSAGFTATSLVFTPALTATVEKGCTVYRSPSDTDSLAEPDKLVAYVLNRDYSFTSETGQITYVAATIPPGNNTPLVADKALSGEVSFPNTATAPAKIPALYGGIEDDDGDLSFPVQTPSQNSEQKGHLDTEAVTIAAIKGLTQTSSIVSGTMVKLFPAQPSSPSITVNFALGAVSPAVQIYDLVRILNGVNAVSNPAFRRITAFTPTSVTVALVDAWDYFSGNYQFEVATAASLTPLNAQAYFLAPVPPSTFVRLFDSAANFTATAKVGETVVIQSLPNEALRRQIRSIINGQTLELDKPVTLVSSPNPQLSYRIIASLNSYGNTPSDLRTALIETVSAEKALYLDEQAYLLSILDLAFTDVVKPAPLTGSVSGSTLTDLEATFVASKLTVQDAIYIAPGPANAGVYGVQEILDDRHLIAAKPFPVATNVTYRAVSVDGLSVESAQAVLDLYQASRARYSEAQAFYILLTTPIAVLGDANAYATALTDAGLDSRLDKISLRLDEIDASLKVIADITTNVDQLYDKRYVWIDARINLEDGLLVRQDTAIKNRIKAQAEILKQLTKLLAVEG